MTSESWSPIDSEVDRQCNCNAKRAHKTLQARLVKKLHLALPYRTFDRVTRVDQGAIVENNRLSEALEMCRTMQAELPPKLRSRKAPAQAARPAHLFLEGHRDRRQRPVLFRS
jgi:hypothetical protein